MCPRVEECSAVEVRASEDCSSSERRIVNIPHYWKTDECRARLNIVIPVEFESARTIIQRN